MTNQQREALRQAARQADDATPEWYEFHNFVDSFLSPTDAAFIASASPSAILALLDECEELRRLANKACNKAEEAT